MLSAINIQYQDTFPIIPVQDYGLQWLIIRLKRHLEYVNLLEWTMCIERAFLIGHNVCRHMHRYAFI